MQLTPDLFQATSKIFTVAELTRQIRGALETQQGTGTFISHKKVKRDDVERERQLNQLVSEFVSRAGSSGFTIEELLEQLHDRSIDVGKKRR